MGVGTQSILGNKGVFEIEKISKCLGNSSFLYKV